MQRGFLLNHPGVVSPRPGLSADVRAAFFQRRTSWEPQGRTPSMAEIQSNDWELKWELLVADAWADPALKKRLMDDPAKVLAERGISVPQGTQVKIVEDSANVTHLVIPTKPAE